MTEEHRDPLHEELLAIIECDDQVARIQAQRAERIDRARRLVLGRRPEDRSLGGPKWSVAQVARREIVSELAAALRVSEGEAHRLTDTAEGLAGEFSATLEALSAGLFSYRHAQVIVRFGAHLADDARGAYEERMLELAPQVTVTQLENLARGVCEEVEAKTAVERHERAAESRYLSRENAADGMAYLTLFTPAVEAVAIENYATDIAKSAKNAGDPRSMTQLKVDAVSDLILNGQSAISGNAKGIVPRVHVTVPAMTLLGASDEPAILEGYGPIDPATAKRLTVMAPSFVRVLTDPITGGFLRRGRRRYKPSAVLRELVELSHRNCRFVTCVRPASTSEKDHTEDFATGGETIIENLAPLCPSHHNLKGRTSWGLKQLPDGAMEWLSPAGFRYTTTPHARMRPAPTFLHPPPGAGDDDPPF